MNIHAIRTHALMAFPLIFPTVMVGGTHCFAQKKFSKVFFFNFDILSQIQLISNWTKRYTIQGIIMLIILLLNSYLKLL